MPDVHAKLPPSSAKRWIHCPPSALDNAKAPRQDTVYTREGTLAHAICERKARICFCGDTEAQHLDEEIEQLSDKLYSPEMEHYTDKYIFALQDIYDSFPVAPVVKVEQRLEFGDWIPEGFGTADCVMAGLDDIYIIDFKYGKGVEVSAVENPQMMVYALGVLSLYDGMMEQENIHMVIVQPRITSEPSVYEMKRTELLDWAEHVLKPAALLAFKGEGERKMGDWCKFCVNNGKCRAQLEEFEELPSEKPPNELAPKELTHALELGAVLEDWIKCVKAYALECCLDGKPVEGWKAVEGRTNRKWGDQAAAFKAAKDSGYPEEMLYERRPLTVAALEKAMGKKQFNAMLGAYVTKDAGEPALAKASDKRDPILRTVSVEDDFKD